jgi:hypothetical protein
MAAILYTLEKNIILKVEMAITAKKKKHSKTRKNISRRIIQKTKKYYKKYQKCQKGGSGNGNYVELEEINLNQEVANAVQNLALRKQQAATLGTSNPRYSNYTAPPTQPRAAHAARYGSVRFLPGHKYSTVAHENLYSEPGHPVYENPVPLVSRNNPRFNSYYKAPPTPPPRAAHAAPYGSVRFLQGHEYSTVEKENPYSKPQNTVYKELVPLRSTNNGIKTNIYNTFLDARKQIHKNEVKKWQNRLGNITDFSKINIQNLADQFKPKNLSVKGLAMGSKSTGSRLGSRSGYRPSIKQKLSGR